MPSLTRKVRFYVFAGKQRHQRYPGEGSQQPVKRSLRVDTIGGQKSSCGHLHMAAPHWNIRKQSCNIIV
jgi:hypothetical protein